MLYGLGYGVRQADKIIKALKNLSFPGDVVAQSVKDTRQSPQIKAANIGNQSQDIATPITQNDTKIADSINQSQSTIEKNAISSQESKDFTEPKLTTPVAKTQGNPMPPYKTGKPNTMGRGKDSNPLYNPKDEGGVPNPQEVKTIQIESKVTDAFKKSTNQKKVGQFELGSFGKNSFAKKAGQPDRFPASELEDTQKHITEAYKASTDPNNYRKDNIAWIAKMPDGETRVIYTRQNAKGAEEIINGHIVSNPQFEETLKSYGTPDQSRTGILSLERSGSSPLTYGDKANIPPSKSGNNPLTLEAQKYESAEEFVAGQGTPIYHRTSAESARSISSEGFKIPSVGTKRGDNVRDFGDVSYFSTKTTGLARYGNTRVDAVLPKDAKILDLTGGKRGGEYAGDVDVEQILRNSSVYLKNYDAIRVVGGQWDGLVLVKDPSIIKTKSQLTDFYNKVKGETPKKGNKPLNRGFAKNP